MDERDVFQEIFARHTGIDLSHLAVCDRWFPGWGRCLRVAECGTPGCELREEESDPK